MRVAAAIAVMLFAGCGTRRAVPPSDKIDMSGWPNGPTVDVGLHRVTLPSDDPADEARITRAIEFWVRSWEIDEGWIVPATRFAVVDGPVPVADAGCWSYQGQWRGGDVI